MISEKLFKQYYASPQYDGTLTFYSWFREYTNQSTRLLNLGAGQPTRNAMRIFKGEIAEVIGADIDPIVLDNFELDRAYLIVDGVIPQNDSSFDVVISDYVLEHVKEPSQFIAEVYRVLRPGGSFFFRTPNMYHYVSIFSALTPHWVHNAIANSMRGLPVDAHEPWPTYYRMNTRSKLSRLAKEANFSAAEFRMIECQPSYLVFHPVPFMFGVAYERPVNATDTLSGCRANICGRLTR